MPDPTRGILYPALDSKGRMIVLSGRPTLAKRTSYTFDFSKKQTWYQNAVRVVDAVATCDNPPTRTIYSVAHTYLIDSYHGLITGEDHLKDADGNTYRVVVKVNGVTKTEQDPHTGSGGDYTINYPDGKITFLSALGENDEVKVTYHYATTSLFTLKPKAGKLLYIETAKVQFTSDLDMTDTVNFQIYGNAESFLDPNPYPPGTKIPLTDTLVYKGMRDLLSDADVVYRLSPNLGGTSWRGLNQESVILRWDYVSRTVLYSSKGMEIRIWLTHDVPYTGTLATATFYCTEEDE